jgi:hypothetical protein
VYDLRRLVLPRRISPGAALALIALAGAGCLIAWVDSRPGWDDTGITAAALLGASFLAGVAGVPPVVAALLAAGPLIAVEWDPAHPALLAVLAFPAAGALAGSFLSGSVAGKSRTTKK